MEKTTELRVQTVGPNKYKITIDWGNNVASQKMAAQFDVWRQEVGVVKKNTQPAVAQLLAQLPKLSRTAWEEDRKTGHWGEVSLQELLAELRPETTLVTLTNGYSEQQVDGSTNYERITLVLTLSDK